MENDTQIRLNKFIAMAGIASRRKSEDLITGGRVKVNGVVIKELTTRINPNIDEIKIDNEQIKPKALKYFIINKPRGYICSDTAFNDDRLVKDLAPEVDKDSLFCVGRLDKDSMGLILLTNDGQIKQAMSHPAFKCEKEYLVKTFRGLSNEELEKIKNGVEIEIEKIINNQKTAEMFFAKPHKFEVVKNAKFGATLLITLLEGKKRQLRLMFKKIDVNGIQLKRVRIGGIKIGDLESGACKELSQEEVKKAINL